MPIGVYPRTEKQKLLSKKLGLSRKGKKPYEMTSAIKERISQGLKGNIPYNKGKESPEKLKKIDRFHMKMPINCEKHGDHLKWRLITGNNVQCMVCAATWQLNQRRRNPLRFILRDAKKHAEYKSREFSLTLEQLERKMEIQMNCCVYTGLEFNDGHPPSLDRINSELGYNIDNIQFVNIRINKMKSDMTENEFITMCAKVVAYSEAGKSKPKKKK